MAPGDRLPTVLDMERHFGVAKSTVEAAMRLVRQEGLIDSRQGSGSFVAGKGLPLSRGTGMVPGVATDTLAVLAPLQNPFFRHCLDALTAEAARRGLRVIFHHTTAETATRDALGLTTLRPAGYVLFNYLFAPAAREMIERGLRAVVIGVPPAGVFPDVPCVYGDHDLGGSVAAGRLLQTGHRRISYVNEFVKNDLRQTRRWQSHVRAIREAGIPDADAVIEVPTWNAWREDSEAALRFFAAPNSPTGLVVWSDATAVEILYLLHRAGLRVPEDVSVVGYDNLPAGAHSQPPLDTVETHIDVQVRQALDMLTLDQKPGGIPIAVVTPNLARRESVAPPRA